MIETSAFARQAENELRSSRTISPRTHAAWNELQPEAHVAFSGAMSCFGFPEQQALTSCTNEDDRIAAARLLLLQLGLDTNDPRWSSAVLDQLLKTVMATPGGAIGDLLYAVAGILEEYQPDLSASIANFLQDLVVKCFTSDRKSYESVDWPKLVGRIGAHARASQLYFAMHALPDRFMSEELTRQVLSGLEKTPYREEALRLLAA